MAAVRPLRLRVTAWAPSHLLSIRQYIAERNPAAARAVGARIRLALDMLCDFPGAGHAGRSRGTQEWVVRGLPYIIVYEVFPEGADELVVLGVFHGAQDRD